MFDVKTKLENNGEIVGYRLTDRKEDIVVSVEQFNRLVDQGLVYSVVHSKHPDRIVGIKRLNLDNTIIEKYGTIDKVSGPIRIKYKVVRYRTNKLIEMLQYKHLDYVQQKYFTNEFVKLENTNIVKSIQALEKLTGSFNREDCTDIEPFFENFKNKYEVIGYCIENIGNRTFVIRENTRRRYKKIAPGRSIIVSNKEMHLLCKLYKLDKDKMITKAEDMMLAIEHTTDNKLLEQLSKSERKRVINDNKYKSSKDNLAKQILKEEDYIKYKETGKAWDL